MKICKRCTTELHSKSANFCHHCGLAVTQEPSPEINQYLKHSLLSEQFHNDYLAIADQMLGYNEGVTWVSDHSLGNKKQLGSHVSSGTVGYIIVTLSRIIMVSFRTTQREVYGFENSWHCPIQPFTNDLTTSEIESRNIWQVKLEHLYESGYYEFDDGNHGYSKFSLRFVESPRETKSQFFVYGRHVSRNLKDILDRNSIKTLNHLTQEQATH